MIIFCTCYCQLPFCFGVPSIVAFLQPPAFRINFSQLNSPGGECMLHVNTTNLISEMALVVASFTNLNIVFCANCFHVLTQFEMYFGVKYDDEWSCWKEKCRVAFILNWCSEHAICMSMLLQCTHKIEINSEYMNKSNIEHGCLLD